MLYMVNTTILSWDMDDYRKHGQKTLSLWNVVLSENAENIVDGEGFKRRSFRRAKIKKRLYNIIQTIKLQYFGHIIRQNGDTLHRTVLDGKVNGSRGGGRPRTKWTTNITKWTGLEYHQAVRQAQHCQEWKTIASNPRQEDGTWWWWWDV